jgi:hypothetical protein
MPTDRKTAEALLDRLRYAAVAEDGHSQYGNAESYAKAKAEYEAARAAVLDAMTETGWRSVETDAPPHGQPVLLWIPAFLGFPDGEMECRPYSMGRPGSRSYHAHATHWMPLPAAPQKEEKP